MWIDDSTIGKMHGVVCYFFKDEELAKINRMGKLLRKIRF